MTTRPPVLRRIVPLAALLLVLGTSACGSDGEGDQTTTTVRKTPGMKPVSGTVSVFADAALTDAFTTLAEAFEAANPDATVELTFGPSSGLATRIIEGAPADLIATASQTSMQVLEDADALASEPVAFVTNVLQIAVPPGNPGGVDGLDDLANEDLAVALCAAEVPCGELARGVLEGAGVTPSIDSEEEDVRTLLAKIEAGEVDVGIVYQTDVMAAGDAVEGIEIPITQNRTATYPIATVDDPTDPAVSGSFILFVLSDEGQAILKVAGFGPA